MKSYSKMLQNLLHSKNSYSIAISGKFCFNHFVWTFCQAQKPEIWTSTYTYVSLVLFFVWGSKMIYEYCVNWWYNMYTQLLTHIPSNIHTIPYLSHEQYAIIIQIVPSILVHIFLVRIYLGRNFVKIKFSLQLLLFY